MLSWLGAAARTSAAAHSKALAAPVLEDIERVEEAETFVGGGQETKGALPVVSPPLVGSVYSSRGRGYAPYNEDAAFLFRTEGGPLVLAVLDQAGGLGGRVRGEASGRVAARLARGLQRLEGEVGSEALRLRFSELIHEAHHDLLSRDQGEVTTAVAARIDAGGGVVGVTSGDSGLVLFDENGLVLQTNVRHEAADYGQAGCLTHAVGLAPEGPTPETFSWQLPVGGAVMACSDGLLDAGLGLEDIGRMWVDCADVNEAMNALVTKVLRRMALYRAKPDNLTIAVVRRNALDVPPAGEPVPK